MSVLRWLLRLLPDDPRFCAHCGRALVRDESDSFDPRSGERRPLPYAACPEIDVYRYPRGWEIRGGWPEHTAILREPRWRDREKRTDRALIDAEH